MGKIKKLKLKLQRGSGLSCQEVRALLGFVGFKLARQKGSHEQWVRAGKAFTLTAHGKDAPHYILDALRKLIEEDDGKGKEKNKK